MRFEKFELVKSYYNHGQWKINAVRDAVVKGWITAEEFEEITGQPYNVDDIRNGVTE